MTVLRGALAVAVSAAALTACGQSAAAPTAKPTPTPSPVNQPTALGATGKILGNAKVTSLAAGPLHVSYVAVTQPASTSIANGTQTGFIYDIDGLHRVTGASGQSVDVNPGEGAYVDGASPETHVNPNSAQNVWYMVGIQDSAARSSGPPFPGSRTVYNTPDLPAFGPGTYDETLRLTTITPGGRTQAHLHGGIEVIYQLQGTSTVRIAGVGAVNLKVGQGVRILPGTPLQNFNTGATPALLLVFLVTLDGAPFQTNLNTSP